MVQDFWDILSVTETVNTEGKGCMSDSGVKYSIIPCVTNTSFGLEKTFKSQGENKHETKLLKRPFRSWIVPCSPQ